MTCFLVDQQPGSYRLPLPLACAKDSSCRDLDYITQWRDFLPREDYLHHAMDPDKNVVLAA